MITLPQCDRPCVGANCAALADVIIGEGMDGLSESGVDRLIEGVRERLSADTRAQEAPR